MKKSFLQFAIIFLFFGVSLNFCNLAFAGETVLPSTNNQTYVCDPKNKCTDLPCKKYCGFYEVDDTLRLADTIAKIFFRISGGLALLAFVAGGLMFVFSAGNKTWVDRGKATIIGAVIGLIVVFFSYTIVKFVFDEIKGEQYSDNPFVSGPDGSLSQ